METKNHFGHRVKNIQNTKRKSDDLIFTSIVQLQKLSLVDKRIMQT